MEGSRLSHPLWRCNACKRLLTAIQIQKVWEHLEASGEPSKGVCPCGGGRISPTNPTPEEYETLGSLEQLRRYREGVRDDKTRLWEQALLIPGVTLTPEEQAVLDA